MSVAEGVLGKYAFQTIMNAGTVAAKIETSRRREVLPYAHHVDVASLAPAEQDEMLDKAEANQWSHRELRDAVELMKGRRVLEVRWGELLGDAEIGANQHGQGSHASEGSPLGKDERHRFRQLAAGKLVSGPCPLWPV